MKEFNEFGEFYGFNRFGGLEELDWLSSWFPICCLGTQSRDAPAHYGLCLVFEVNCARENFINRT